MRTPSPARRTRPQIGHLLGGAGAAELAITAWRSATASSPPTLNLTDPDPACDLDGTPLVGRSRPIRAALKLSLGFGGHLAVAVLRRPDGPRREAVVMSDRPARLDRRGGGRTGATRTRPAARRPRSGPAGRIERDGRWLLDFASNDYLGLASDPRLAAAAAEAAGRYGWGAGASPLVCGWRTPHQELAEALADFEGTEAVALFPTGFAANLGTIAALVGRGDAVYGDRLNHACLVAGARLSGASLRVYPHNDADRLAAALRRDRGRYRRLLIATDGVFSMDGDLAPLPDLADLAERHGAMLLVDEAHGTGVFGPDGRGSVSELRRRRPGPRPGRDALEGARLDRRLRRRFAAARRPAAQPRPDLHLLDRPAAGRGGGGARGPADRPGRALASRARPAGSAAGSAIGSTAAGVPVPEVAGPIVPAILGDADRALDAADRLLGTGVLAPAIRPPTVPAGTARLRLSVSAVHTEAEIDRVAAAVASAWRAATDRR